MTPTTPRAIILPRAADMALELCVDFGAEDEDETDFVVAGRVVVEIFAAVATAAEPTDAAAAVGAAPEALVTPLICAWTAGLNCPDMLERL